MDDSPAHTPVPAPPTTSPAASSRRQFGTFMATFPDARVDALTDILAERMQRSVAGLTLVDLINEVGFQACGREDADYADPTCYPLIRPELVRAAALLLTAIELIDESAATPATAATTSTSSTEVRA